MKKLKIYFINIILCLLIFLLALYLNNIYPFGNELLGKSDGFVIFKPMLYDFIMKIKTGTLTNYSFNNGLGTPLIFSYWYCLVSPFTLIALLFNNMNAMYLSVILSKIVITAICMVFYLSKKTNKSSIITIGTVSYVFSSWLLAYYYYLPWLDIFMVFPLFNYGLEQLLDNNQYVFNTNEDYYLIEIENENGGINIIPQNYKKFTQDVKYGKYTATIHVVNEDKLKEIYNYLSKNQIKYSYYNDNHMKGTINVDKDQIIFTSIPYDKDWEVKIDGKKVKTIELLDSLMGIEVKPGTHEIELKYKTHYLFPALISITSFLLIILNIKKRRKKYEK